MSLLPTYVAARLRKNDSSPQPTAGSADSDVGDDDDIFGLLPPESAAPVPRPEAHSNRRPVNAIDLGRLSIDGDNWLYWDGKPVATRGRIVMSRAQLAGAGIVAVFVIIGACGAALQGAIAVRDWACRSGWAAGACAAPALPLNRFEIPA